MRGQKKQILQSTILSVDRLDRSLPTMHAGPTSPSSTPPSSSAVGGVIIGASVGGAAAIAALGLLAWFLFRRRATPSSSKDTDPSDPTPEAAATESFYAVSTGEADDPCPVMPFVRITAGAEAFSTEGPEADDAAGSSRRPHHQRPELQRLQRPPQDLRDEFTDDGSAHPPTSSATAEVVSHGKVSFAPLILPEGSDLPLTPQQSLLSPFALDFPADAFAFDNSASSIGSSQLPGASWEPATTTRQSRTTNQSAAGVQGSEQVLLSPFQVEAIAGSSNLSAMLNTKVLCLPLLEEGMFQFKIGRSVLVFSQTV